MKKLLCIVLILLLGVFVFAGCSQSSPQVDSDEPVDKEIILATTTSTYDSGLLDKLIPIFEEKTGYRVKPIAVGTGKALAMGNRGDADVLLVHAPEAEMELVKNGSAVNRQLVMHNDFVVAGPAEDPAGIGGMSNVIKAFEKIAASQSLFISRGDDSGTHKKEKKIWSAAGISPQGEKWYQETGTGMGQTLKIASEKQGYVLTDRATYLSLKDNLDLKILVQNHPMLLNIYHVMQVNPEKFENINAEGAKAFVDFMLDAKTQKIIGEFGKDNYGEPLFFPDAGKKEEDLK